MSKATSWNIYGDKKVQKQCAELQSIIKLMPKNSSKLRQEARAQRQKKIVERIAKLNVNALAMVQEVNNWKALPPKQVLDNFVGALIEDNNS